MSEERHYLKVHIEGPYVSDDHTRYELIDGYKDEDGEVLWSNEELEERAQDVVNQVYSWGHSVVPESEVPEDERD